MLLYGRPEKPAPWRDGDPSIIRTSDMIADKISDGIRREMGICVFQRSFLQARWLQSPVRSRTELGEADELALKIF
jgi:hypothetical protein